MSSSVKGFSGSDNSNVAFRILGILFLLIISAVVAYGLARLGYDALFAIGVPVSFLLILVFARAPKAYSSFMFIASYFICDLVRYATSFKAGIAFDAGLVIFLFLIFFNTIFGHVEWRRALNSASLFTFIWLIYCFFELFNPRVVSTDAWLVTVRWTAVYYFLVVFFTPVIINSVKDVKVFLRIWSILTIIAVIWIAKQKFIGLDSAEKAWLYDPMISNTHVLPFGIRYWSFFSDAANAAVCLALSSAFFGIMAFFADTKKEMRYYLFIAIFALWGSLFTGTRSHVVIPFLALIILIICSRNSKLTAYSFITFISLFVFFRFTHIGDNNKYIWRARSTFFLDQDASYVLRQMNHKKIRNYMKGKPFGIGLGLAEWKAKRFVDNSEISNINTDSWLYTLFVETGFVGVALYVAIYIFFIFYGIWISLFRIKTKFVRGISIASTGMLSGMLVSSYGNEILAQFPNGIITFVVIGLLFLCTSLDKEAQPEQKEA